MPLQPSTDTIEVLEHTTQAEISQALPNLLQLHDDQDAPDTRHQDANAMNHPASFAEKDETLSEVQIDGTSTAEFKTDEQHEADVITNNIDHDGDVDHENDLNIVANEDVNHEEAVSGGESDEEEQTSAANDTNQDNPDSQTQSKTAERESRQTTPYLTRFAKLLVMPVIEATAQAPTQSAEELQSELQAKMVESRFKGFKLRDVPESISREVSDDDWGVRLNAKCPFHCAYIRTCLDISSPLRSPSDPSSQPIV